MLKCLEECGWPYFESSEPYIILAPFDVNKINIEWPYEKVVLNAAFIGIKTALGTFSKIIPFK